MKLLFQITCHAYSVFQNDFYYFAIHNKCQKYSLFYYNSIYTMLYHYFCIKSTLIKTIKNSLKTSTKKDTIYNIIANFLDTKTFRN